MENFLVHNRVMRPKDWAIDAGIALAAFLFGCAQLMLAASSIIIPDLALRQYLGPVNVVPDISVFVALALTTLPLAVRRRFPWPVFLFVLITFLGLQNAFRGFSLAVVGPMVALFTIARERDRLETVGASLVALAGFVLVIAPGHTAGLIFFERLQNIAFMAASAIAGYAFRTYQAYVHATEQRAFEAERSREEEAARRVEQERVRIAREVHDITAHSLSAVSIQAAAAERLIDRDPAAAKEAIASVRATSKSALDDIRSMIGVLRHGDEAAESAPTAGTDRLGDLASYLRDAGIEVTVDDARYDRARVPAYIDMALFGIAREAVTNIVRHAHASCASLRLSLDGGWVRLAVENNDSAPSFKAEQKSQSAGVSFAQDGGGHGIEGMAERVNLLGGTFTATPLTQGGFLVVACIPLSKEECV